jgi:hypothetical protein
MFKRIINILCVWLLVLNMAPVAHAQYFSNLYDYDSSSDFGLDVRILSDGNYLTIGGGLNATSHEQGLEWMVIAKDGSSIINKHGLSSSFGPYYVGWQGRVKTLSGGGYILPVTEQRYKNPYTEYSECGIVKLNAALDTVFVKLYTDTSHYFESGDDVVVLPAGAGYILGGTQADTAVDSLSSVLLVRIDTNGNLLWKHTYHKVSGDNEELNSISLLADGRILVGAQIEALDGWPGDVYYRLTPWYILLDTAGNILKDLVWNSGHTGGGTIYPDANGGYIHFGALDTILASPSSALINFPNYVAHTDTNFLPDWGHRFPSNNGLSINTNIENVKQLHNGDYLAIGEELYDYPTSHIAYRGWAAKLDKKGNLLWERNYEIDTNRDCEFTDAQERADGSIILTGDGVNTALPVWHYKDVWLLSIDSNGCEMPGCALGVPVVQTMGDELKVYPNPIKDAFTIESAAAGQVEIYDAAGRRVVAYKVQQGINQYRFQDVSSGVYIGRYVSGDGGAVKMLRLVKE